MGIKLLGDEISTENFPNFQIATANNGDSM
jgi:hypothetical protein